MKLAASIFFLALSSLAFGQGTTERPNYLRITFPTGTKPEAVRIDHAMSGPFGGVGGRGLLKPDQNVYEFAMAYEGKRATAIKGFIYMPGCEFFTWDEKLEPTSDLEFKPECKRQPPVSFKGKIVGELPASQNAEVVVYYLAHWSHRFYGISDGMVPMLEIARIPIGSDGEFEITLPDLFNDPTHLRWQVADHWKATFSFTLRHAKTWNILAWLRPAGAKGPSNDLEIQPSYPPVVEFVARIQEQKPKQQ